MLKSQVCFISRGTFAVGRGRSHLITHQDVACGKTCNSLRLVYVDIDELSTPKLLATSLVRSLKDRSQNLEARAEVRIFQAGRYSTFVTKNKERRTLRKLNSC